MLSAEWSWANGSVAWLSRECRKEAAWYSHGGASESRHATWSDPGPVVVPSVCFCWCCIGHPQLAHDVYPFPPGHAQFSPPPPPGRGPCLSPPHSSLDPPRPGRRRGRRPQNKCVPSPLPTVLTRRIFLPPHKPLPSPFPPRLLFVPSSPPVQSTNYCRRPRQFRYSSAARAYHQGLRQRSRAQVSFA